MTNFKTYPMNKCEICGKENCKTTTERVPSRGIKKLCDDCLGELCDYYDNQRKERKTRDRLGDE